VGLIEFIKIQMKLEEAFHTRVDLISSDGLSPHIRPFIEKDKMLIYEA
jgi:predicted nucleotidyltransferase